MSAPRRPEAPECFRQNPTRDHVRIDSISDHFGIAFGALTLKTYYIPPASKIRNRGGHQAFVTFECAKGN